MKNFLLFQVEIPPEFYYLTWPKMLFIGGLLLLFAVVPFLDAQLKRFIVVIAVLMMIVGGLRLWYVESYKSEVPAAAPQQSKEAAATESSTTDKDTQDKSGKFKKGATKPPPEEPQMVPQLTEYSGRVADKLGNGVSDGELYLNGQKIANTNETGDFSFSRPANFDPNSYAKLECRKKTDEGVFRASTNIDLAHSNHQLLLKEKEGPPR